MAAKHYCKVAKLKLGHLKASTYQNMTKKNEKNHQKSSKWGNFNRVAHFDPEKRGKSEFSGYSGYATSKEYNFMKRY